MNKVLRSLVCSLLLLGTTSSVAREPIAPFTHNPEAIVRVVCKEGVGSATRVREDGLFVSVDHVTRNTECKVGGQELKMTYVNAEQDFSTFMGPAGKAVIPFSCRGIKFNQPYVMRGYPAMADALFFMPVLFVAKYYKWYTYVGNVYPGMSGGPVLDKDGNTVGTVNVGNPTGGVALADTVLCKGKK